MAFNQKFAQLQPFSLAGSGVSIGDTSITLTSFQTIDGELLSMTDFGNIGYGTLEPNNGIYEEQISFTGVTQNIEADTCTLTGVKNVLFTTPYTQSSGLKKSHIGGSKFVVSNTSAMYQTVIDYIDNIAISGSPVASTTTLGISKISTTPVDIGIPITVGTNDPRVPTTDQAAALAGTGTPSVSNKFVTADTDALKELLANKDTTTTLGTSDTKYPSQKAVKIYVDSNPVAMRHGIESRAGATANGTVTYAHGLGRTPRRLKITAFTGIEANSSAGNQVMSVGVLDDVAQSCARSSISAAGLPEGAIQDGMIIYCYLSNWYQQGTASMDATNISISWTKGGSPKGIYFIWEVE